MVGELTMVKRRKRGRVAPMKTDVGLGNRVVASGLEREKQHPGVPSLNTREFGRFVAPG